MSWIVAFHQAAETEFLSQPAGVQAKLERIKALIDNFSLEHVPAKMRGAHSGPTLGIQAQGQG